MTTEGASHAHAPRPAADRDTGTASATGTAPAALTPEPVVARPATIPVAPVAAQPNDDAGAGPADSRPVESRDDLAKRLTAAGRRLVNDNGTLKISNPETLTETDKAAIREHREWLLATIATKPAPAAPKAINLPPESMALTGVVLPADLTFDRALEPRNLAEAGAIAESAFASKLGFGHPNAAAALMVIIAGRELGLPVAASLRAFHVIENKPTLSADAMRALVLKSGKAEYFRCTERTPERATFVTKRKGDAEEVSLTATIEEAKVAGVVKPNSAWVKYAADLLVARSSSKLARLVYPDVIGGLYSPEEFDNQ